MILHRFWLLLICCRGLFSIPPVKNGVFYLSVVIFNVRLSYLRVYDSCHAVIFKTKLCEILKSDKKYIFYVKVWHIVGFDILDAVLG